VTSKASIRPAIVAHYNTLRDDSTGDLRIRDQVLFVGAPVALGASLAIIHFRMQDTASVLAGIAVFTALLFGLVIFVFQLRVQIRGDGSDRERPRVATLIDETFANVTYAVIIGMVTTVVGIVASSINQKDLGAPIWASALLGALLLHLVLTILMCLKRINAAYQQLRQN